MNEPVTQTEFGRMVGISQQAVSDLIGRGILARDGSAGEWLIAYCANLREQAAGRGSDGDLDLVQERARLAKEQADKVAMLNGQMRRELVPVSILEVVLARMGRQVGAILEAVPVQIKRASANISSADLQIITDEIIKARNIAAAMELTDEEDSDGHVGDQESDQEGAFDA